MIQLFYLVETYYHLVVLKINQLSALLYLFGL